MTFSGMSDENAARRRSCGEGTRGSSPTISASTSSASASTSGGGASRHARSARSLACRWAACWTWRSSRWAFSSASSSAVPRNSAARGPSRMLARLPPAMGEDLLVQLAVRVRRHAVRVVLEYRHPLHGRLRETNGLLDARGEHPVAEVLLENLDGFLGVKSA